MNVKRFVAALLVVTVLVSAGAPSAVAAGESNSDAGLSLHVGQSVETGEVTVAVTHDGTAAENATVEVDAADGSTYAGEGTYRTNGDGTVTLDAPDERVSVTVTATANGTTVNETGALVPLSESLAVDVAPNGDGTATVRVTQYGAPLANATVEVNAAGNETYAGEGAYESGENGTVALPEPGETVTVNVTATTGTLTAETSAKLAPSSIDVRVEQQNETVTVTVTRVGHPVENATVTVASDGAYAETGEYATDENGTVALSAPEKSVAVTVTAADGNDEATTTVTLERPGDPTANDFSQRLRAFLELLRQNVDGGLGQDVSEFVRGNNPASADDRRGENRSGGDGTERGPPEHAKGHGHGPNAAGSADAATTTTTEAPENETDGGSESGDDGGADDHPGNGRGNGR